MKPKQYLAFRNILIEFLGTMTIVYFTNWANILFNLEEVKVGIYGLIYGLITSLMIYIGILTSGGIFDPAVTLSYLYFGKLGFNTAIPFVLVQFLGGMIATVVIMIQLNDETLDLLEGKSAYGVSYGIPDNVRLF